MEPSFLAVWALANNLIDKMSENSTLISDGFPRNLTEAGIIDEAIAFTDLKMFIRFLLKQAEMTQEKGCWIEQGG